MNPHTRSLAAVLAPLIVAAAYFVYQGRLERPAPPRPASSLSAARPAGLPPASPTAREMLDRRVTLDLRWDQIARLEALDHLWAREVSGLQAMIQDAEREFSIFATEAQGKTGASLPEIQRRSAVFSRLSAELRDRRQHHTDAALGVLSEWQRRRLAQSRQQVVEGRSHEAARK